MQKAKVLRANEGEFKEFQWGTLTWYASAKQNNSTDMTIGRCVIKPGQENPLHSHPNCSEVLVVLQGTVMHTIENGEEVELNPGDTITLPADLPHKARNATNSDVVLFIAFSSADRETRGE